MASPEALDEDEFVPFGYLGISLFRRFENVFFQHQSDMIDDDFWDGHRDNILWFFHRPGMQAWWKDRKFAFSKSFREFLDQSTAGDCFATEPWTLKFCTRKRSLGSGVFSTSSGSP